MSEQVGNTRTGSTTMGPRDVLVHGRAQAFTQEIVAGPHRLAADEPEDVGGSDEGPTPYDLLLAALGSCTSMTIGAYARRNKWPLQDVNTRLRHSRIHATDCEECETKEGRLDRIELDIELVGPLSAGQRAKLLEIAKKCPIHRTLLSEIDIQTKAMS